MGRRCGVQNTRLCEMKCLRRVAGLTLWVRKRCLRRTGIGGTVAGLVDKKV